MRVPPTKTLMGIDSKTSHFEVLCLTNSATELAVLALREIITVSCNLLN